MYYAFTTFSQTTRQETVHGIKATDIEDAIEAILWKLGDDRVKAELLRMDVHKRKRDVASTYSEVDWSMSYAP